MEKISYTFPATKQIEHFAHVGVVGSGDLEVIIKPTNHSKTNITIRTGIRGYKTIWESVIHRFFQEHDISAEVKINDFGATPGVVKLRLEQALEVCCHDKYNKN
ncbi:malonate decarboxylase subunit delta [Bacillus sp. AFS040349]|uniref:malonate decarboxylase subunit delta n=1 Tax=Bacillus sp. AFS040349 TaxID=2033502 RepID=UPI000BFC339B|nr:malonate decarboxylase subunit delta [Bacillus sp. AFS040349]PGT84376.1 malonate decarboxylase acyl carrier protein [Bacillus sp. AFS040349]